MKKTIAAIALMASSTTVMAMPPPPSSIPPKTICLKTYASEDGSKSAGTCDESDNNAALNRRLQENGCAANQVAITTSGRLNIGKCLPAGAIQL